MTFFAIICDNHPMTEFVWIIILTATFYCSRTLPFLSLLSVSFAPGWQQHTKYELRRSVESSALVNEAEKAYKYAAVSINYGSGGCTIVGSVLRWKLLIERVIKPLTGKLPFIATDAGRKAFEFMLRVLQESAMGTIWMEHSLFDWNTHDNLSAAIARKGYNGRICRRPGSTAT